MYHIYINLLWVSSFDLPAAKKVANFQGGNLAIWLCCEDGRTPENSAGRNKITFCYPGWEPALWTLMSGAWVLMPQKSGCRSKFALQNAWPCYKIQLKALLIFYFCMVFTSSKVSHVTLQIVFLWKAARLIRLTRLTMKWHLNKFRQCSQTVANSFTRVKNRPPRYRIHSTHYKTVQSWVVFQHFSALAVHSYKFSAKQNSFCILNFLQCSTVQHQG